VGGGQPAGEMDPDWATPRVRGLTIVDANNTPVAGAQVDVDATKPDGSVTALSATSNSSGRARVSLTIKIRKINY
jgi:hypothetical protein